MQRKLLYTLIITLIAVTALHAQNIVINEICSRNYNSYEDDEEDFGDWVEFYNTGSSSINMAGMYLTDDLSNLTKFQIPSTNLTKTRISADNHRVFWFDGDTHKDETHVSFKLNNNGEQLALVAADGITIIDSITFGALSYDVTFGRKTDGSSTWVYFKDPTPDDENDEDDYIGIAGKADFSHAAGFYSSPIQVQLIYHDSQAKIYYSLNGNDPSPSKGILYTGAINLDTNSILRARVYKSDHIPGEIISRSFFINRPIDLPVLSVVTDPENLWDDDKGIYCFGDDYDYFHPYYGANFWKDWKRPAHIELFLSNGTEAFNQTIDLSISGATSRVYAQKSLNFKAKGALGNDVIPYPIFPQLPITSYKAFKLRNGGGDWSSTGIRDAMNHTLLEGAMDVDHQSNYPVILYLNGQYWGVMTLMEKIDDDYLKGHYPQIDKDSVDILYSDTQVVRGDANNYNAMINFISNNSMTQQSNYNYIKSQIDIPSFINYFESRIYYATTDWPQKNIKYWRPRDQSMKWRWIMWDTDRSTQLTRLPSRRCMYNDNTLAWATTSSAVPNWAQFLLNNLLLNSEFKSQFITQFAHHMNFTFCPLRTDSMINVYRTRLNNELPAHIERWKRSNDTLDYYTVGYYQSLAEWNIEVDTIKLFFDKRARYMRKFIMEKFNINDTSHLTLAKSPPHGGIVFVDTFVVRPNSCNLVYFDDYPVTLTAKPNPGFVFAGWSTTTGDTLPFTWVPDGDTTVTAYFIVAPPTVPSSNITASVSNCSEIHLNWSPGNGASRLVVVKAGSTVDEFPAYQQVYVADSVFGNGDDLGAGNYVVYSGSGNSCIITGLTPSTSYYFSIFEFNGSSDSSNYNINNYLSANATLYVPSISLGNDTTICGHHNILLDAGAGSDSYFWSTGDTTQTILVDTVGIIARTETYTVTGSFENGCFGIDSIRITFDICTDITDGPINLSHVVFPNPFSDEIMIRTNEKNFDLTVIDAMGKTVFNKLMNSMDVSIQPIIAPGIYYLQIITKKEIKTVKIIKAERND